MAMYEENIKSGMLYRYNDLLHRAVQILGYMSTSCKRDVRPRKINGLKNVLRPLCNVLTFTDISGILSELYDETGYEGTMYEEKTKSISYSLAELEPQISICADARAREQTRKLEAAKIKSKQWNEIYANLENWKNDVFRQKIPVQTVLSKLLDSCILSVDADVDEVITALKTSNIVKINMEGAVTYLYNLDLLAIPDLEGILCEQENNILSGLMESCIYCHYNLADTIRRLNIDLASKDHITMETLDKGIEETRLLGLMEDNDMPSWYNRMIRRSRRTPDTEPDERTETDYREYTPVPINWPEMTIRAVILLGKTEADNRPKTEEELRQTLQPLLPLLYVASPRAALTCLTKTESTRTGPNRAHKRKTAELFIPKQSKPISRKIIFGKQIYKTGISFPLDGLMAKISMVCDPKWDRKICQKEQDRIEVSSGDHVKFQQDSCHLNHMRNCRYRLESDARKVALRANKVLVKGDGQQHAACEANVRTWLAKYMTKPEKDFYPKRFSELMMTTSKPGNAPNKPGDMETETTHVFVGLPPVAPGNPGMSSSKHEDMETETAEVGRVHSVTAIFKQLLSLSVDEAIIDPDFLISLLVEVGYLSLEEDMVIYNHHSENRSSWFVKSK